MLKYKDLLKTEWVAHQGSIRTVLETEFKVEQTGQKVKTPIWIAFNVGEDAAEHIVRLHNATLSVAE